MPFLCEAFAPPATPVAEPPPRAVISTVETVLLTALHQDVGLALWLRDMPDGWNREVAPLASAGPFRAMGEGTPDEALDAAVASLPGPAPLNLLSDALRLAHMFAALTRATHIRLRFDGITGDACRKFHVDAVGLRLLVTYAGPGTQWTMADQDAVPHEVPFGAVALFRGRARPGGHVLHRSPPLSHLPEARRRRLVLCIDEAGCC
ncbi:DUF1826 domain-containing protein [Roseococcus suduntuyensis]|uniref:DUF1826 domain-containing protein n=1 Tax=Roseococcus suduntuyensis TaxID=455361 RepID=A0A840AFV8_9PROT|nr:DUF1826 domain-containing protein [Roseococcus suduntuyensis]MBB3898985.1 hypothetical protein [Roseococcus suduntuyensis]